MWLFWFGLIAFAVLTVVGIAVALIAGTHAVDPPET
jgi:hypothetical protein